MEKLLRTPEASYRQNRYRRRLGATALTVAASALFPLTAQAQPIINNEPITQTAETVSYVALGDSYASGEGNPPFDSGTDIPGVNECHRSQDAYPAVLAGMIGAQLTNVACSRMSPEGLFYPQWNEGISQLDHLDTTTDIVTITIGGNQVNLGELAITCSLSDCGPDTPIYKSIVQTLEDQAFQQRLNSIYKTILEKAPNAKVMVVGYPKFIDTHPVCTVMGWENDTTISHVVDLLNTTARNVVNDAIDDPRLRYVAPPPDIDVCSFKGKFNVLRGLQRPEYFGHPNPSGQEDIAETVLEAYQPPID